MSCFLGWRQEDGNRRGICCCNCKNQVEITSHPWNTMVGGRMKGPVTTTAGWGCCTPEFEGKIIFFEKEHGACELHEWRDVA